jgi:hypothetical protein
MLVGSSLCQHIQTTFSSPFFHLVQLPLQNLFSFCSIIFCLYAFFSWLWRYKDLFTMFLLLSMAFSQSSRCATIFFFFLSGSMAINMGKMSVASIDSSKGSTGYKEYHRFSQRTRFQQRVKCFAASWIFCSRPKFGRE